MVEGGGQRETQNTEFILPTYFELFAESEFQLSPKVCKVCSMLFFPSADRVGIASKLNFKLKQNTYREKANFAS